MVASFVDFPLVSVVIPVFNAAKYVAEALTSITEQAYGGELEIIVLDDASTDGSCACITALGDARIRVVRSEENQGIVWQLNRGITLAQGKYIVRMDADDISLPGRIARQVSFMEAHPRVAACGTWIEVFGRQNFVWRSPTSSEGLRLYALKNSPLAHPTVILRKSVLDAHGLAYKQAFIYVEDYELWNRLAEVGELATLPEVLLRYRMHPAQTGATKAAIQQQAADGLRAAQLRSLGLKLSPADVQRFGWLMDSQRVVPVAEYAPIRRLIASLYAHNAQHGLFDSLKFGQLLADSWLEMVGNVRQFAPQLLPVLLRPGPAPLANLQLPWGLQAKVLVKSLLSWKTRV